MLITSLFRITLFGEPLSSSDISATTMYVYKGEVQTTLPVAHSWVADGYLEAKSEIPDNWEATAIYFKANFDYQGVILSVIKKADLSALEISKKIIGVINSITDSRVQVVLIQGNTIETNGALCRDLVIYKGTDFSIGVESRDVSGNVVDITNSTAEFAIVKQLGVVVITVPCLITNGMQGLLSITLNEIQTAGLEVGKYNYHINITKGEFTSRILNGIIKVER